MRPGGPVPPKDRIAESDKPPAMPIGAPLLIVVAVAAALPPTDDDCMRELVVVVVPVPPALFFFFCFFLNLLTKALGVSPRSTISISAGLSTLRRYTCGLKG